MRFPFRKTVDRSIPSENRRFCVRSQKVKYVVVLPGPFLRKLRTLTLKYDSAPLTAYCCDTFHLWRDDTYLVFEPNYEKNFLVVMSLHSFASLIGHITRTEGFPATSPPSIRWRNMMYVFFEYFFCHSHFTY